MSNSKQTVKEHIVDEVIVLRSVYGKVGMKYFIQPCKDPKTGRLPDCVKPVTSTGDLIITDAERNSGRFFVKETDTISVEDGTTFDLKDQYDKARWEAIKNCPLIAPERFAKDAQGNYLIDGTVGWKSERPRYGVAELYVDRPGYEAQKRISRKKLIHNAASYIINDPRGSEGQRLIARLLGKHMTNIPDADVEDYLLQVAEKSPEKIINLYVGDDLSLRLLFCEATDKRVIYRKQGLYMFSDNVILGASDDAVITWMKEAKNKKTLELIRRDTFPEQYADKNNKE